jgi:hypothetical protein
VWISSCMPHVQSDVDSITYSLTFSGTREMYFPISTSSLTHQHNYSMIVLKWTVIKVIVILVIFSFACSNNTLWSLVCHSHVEVSWYSKSHNIIWKCRVLLEEWGITKRRAPCLKHQPSEGLSLEKTPLSKGL